MEIYFPAWTIPAAITVLAWVAICFWPEHQSRGDYDFGGAFKMLGLVVMGMFVTLIAWLIFFILV